MPLFFASNALYPVSVMPSWLRVPNKVNPLSYEVDALRGLLIGTRALGVTAGRIGHRAGMREEDELIEQARRSREETEQLREESGLDAENEESNDDAAKPREREPWAKTSSGDAEHVTGDD